MSASMFGYNRSGVDPFLRTEKKFLNGNKKNLTLKVVGKFTFFPPPHLMRIRFILIMLLVLPSAASLLAQVNQQNRAAQSAHSPRTYAVVVGISDYESPGIVQLEYAHKDAQVFAEYLKSKPGGSVPEENIRLLVNENATYGAIYDALNWLLEACHKDDLVYFYFSGHGDMENNTIYKLGFLLSYNTPRINYINNAVRIEDLNNIANTLSVTNGAKVILITDACHSGKLAGSDFRGTFLVGEQLRTVQSSEVRITSCAPDQLSVEDKGWGGGRGVFSYYLINGLEGLADYAHDGVITVNEIKKYLDTSLSTDPLLAQRGEKQTPVIKGFENVKLSLVDNATLSSLKKRGPSGLVSPNVTLLKPLPMQPQTYLFNILKQVSIEQLVDFNKLSQLSKDEIPFAFINMATSHNSLFDSLKISLEPEKIATLQKTLRENADALNRFNNKLAVMLSDVGQKVINQYLDGDEAELERRRYYNSNSNGYDVYPKMFAVALKITKPEDYLYRILQVKLHYFAGVAARLKMPTVENPANLFDTAFSEQKKALELDENAAYIQNELGILYSFKKQYVPAEKSYVRATQIAPAWTIPWSNLIGLYTITKDYKKALEATRKAKELQPDFQGIFVNNGMLSEETGNLLVAEESYRRSIKLNSRHYLPFERLGFVYMNTTQYAMADSFFFESEKRKKGFHFHKLPDQPWLDQLGQVMTPEFPCFFDKNDVGKNDVMGNFVWGYLSYNRGEDAVAESKFKQVIALNKTNPLAFHYLGKLLYRQKRWQEADIVFNYALAYYMADSAFDRYTDSLINLLPASKSKECIISTFRLGYYSKIDDHYFLGTMYDSWNHFSEAETHYRAIIAMDPVFIGGYYKLWQMLERTSRYQEAEDVLRNYAFHDTTVGGQELNGFYQRMMQRLPGDAEWYYKGALLLYRLAARHPDDYPVDKKKIEPDTDIEKYAFGKSDFTKPEIVEPMPRQELLPGTFEKVNFSNLIMYPRTEAINYFKTVDSLSQDDSIRADINGKIGDLYVWQGIPERSLPYYKRSIDLGTGNANTRMRFIEVCSITYHLSDALEQLDTLNNRHEINFDKQVLMAKYCIHSGRFSDALKLLNGAQQIHPYRIPAITDLKGRLQLLSNHPKEALPLYMDYLMNDSSQYLTMYTIARLNAQLKNTSEAWRWLKLAIEKGFSYYWVLKYDSVWDAYRSLQPWKDITAKIPVPIISDGTPDQN
ncbi:MAG: hypothetical protein E6H06_00785 [Bacteroidetes bacterium]|nr:MAG: hypothetical protein E6H06_00785 [Bacteroidota bacterium]